MTAGIGYADHPAAWPIVASHPDTLATGFEGRCACRWRGPWRATELDARADISAHLTEKGVDQNTVTLQPPGG